MKDEETVTLTKPQWNVVMLAMLKAPIPYEMSAPIIQMLADKLDLPKQPNGGMEVRPDAPH